jgi:hypothetical protein
MHEDDIFFRTKAQMIVVFMAQLHPAGNLTLDHEVNVLAHPAINA